MLQALNAVRDPGCTVGNIHTLYQSLQNAEKLQFQIALAQKVRLDLFPKPVKLISIAFLGSLEHQDFPHSLFPALLLKLMQSGCQLQRKLVYLMYLPTAKGRLQKHNGESLHNQLRRTVDIESKQLLKQIQQQCGQEADYFSMDGIVSQAQQQLDCLDLQIKPIKLQMIRPVPNFMSFDQAELVWLQPSFLTIGWDNSLENKDFSKSSRIKQLIQKLQLQKLSNSDCQQLKQLVKQDLLLLHSVDISRLNIGDIIDKNGQIFRFILLRLQDFHEKTKPQWKKFFSIQINPVRLEFFYKLFKISRIPNIIALTFCLETMVKIQQLPQKDSNMKQIKVKSLLNFLINLIKLQKFQIYEISEQIKSLCCHFKEYELSAELAHLVKDRYDKRLK